MIPFQLQDFINIPGKLLGPLNYAPVYGDTELPAKYPDWVPFTQMKGIPKNCASKSQLAQVETELKTEEDLNPLSSANNVANKLPRRRIAFLSHKTNC